MRLLRAFSALPRFRHSGPLPPSSLRRTNQTFLPFSTTPSPRNGQSSAPKNANDQEKKSSLLDREAVNTESSEYSKSSSDDNAASQENPAFQAGKTDPDSELESSGPSKSGGDPLDVSPANQEVSKPKKESEQESAKGGDRQASGGGSGAKNRKIS